MKTTTRLLLLGAVGIAVLTFAMAALAGSRTAEDLTNGTPFPMSRNAVLKGVPVKIGDLSLAPAVDAQSTPPTVLNDASLISSCIEIGSKWLHWSAERQELEFNSATWGKVGIDHIQTAYCASGDLILGGYTQPNAEPDSQRRAWVFILTRGQSNPAKVCFTAPLAVGQWPKQTYFNLEEVRFIDPISKKMLFLGASETGERSLLAAPFTIVPPDANAD